GDLRRMLTTRAPRDLIRVRAADLMTATPRTVSADAYATEALRLLQTHRISQLVVTDEGGALLGFVHLQDLLREGIV
ncbi:MAG: CBS domain-containing protein, partial [Catalinimonas sp.]